jgi:hypothetical protein
MRRGELLLWLGFLVLATVGSFTVWAFARTTSVPGWMDFLFGTFAGLASLILYVAILTKHRM